MPSLNFEVLQQAADDISHAKSVETLNLILNRPEISDFINRVDSNDPEILELYESNHEANELDVLDRIISIVALQRVTNRSVQEKDIAVGSITESFKNAKISHQEQIRELRSSTPTLIQEMAQLHRLNAELAVLKKSEASLDRTLVPLMKNNPDLRATREKERQQNEINIQRQFGEKAETPHYKLLASLKMGEVKIERNYKGPEHSNVSGLK